MSVDATKGKRNEREGWKGRRRRTLTVLQDVVITAESRVESGKGDLSRRKQENELECSENVDGRERKRTILAFGHPCAFSWIRICRVASMPSISGIWMSPVGKKCHVNERSKGNRRRGRE